MRCRLRRFSTLGDDRGTEQGHEPRSTFTSQSPQGAGLPRSASDNWPRSRWLRRFENCDRAVSQKERRNAASLSPRLLPAFFSSVRLSLSRSFARIFRERPEKKRGRREIKLFGRRNVYIPAVLYSIHSSSPNTCPSVATTSGFRGRFRKTMQKYAIVGNRRRPPSTVNRDFVLCYCPLPPRLDRFFPGSGRPRR